MGCRHRRRWRDGPRVAVDAATRGLRTLLLEADDFAKGTSSRSTKLVHGGVRYLEQGDIPLVLEALRERGLLHRNAPQLVHHLSFIVPRYQWWEGPFFGIGLKVYDALAGRLNLAPSKLLSREETISRIPNIEPDHLLGGVEYFDGQFDDSRLAVSLAQSAVDHGACVLNYFRVTGLLKDKDMVSGIVCEDQETLTRHEIRARVVINATGIFADSIRKMDDAAAIPAIQPSQGVHLVFERDFLQGDSAIMVPHTDDGRVLFVIPWHGKVLVGTTDTAMQTPELEPKALDEEIGFILRNAARYLARDPQRSDILSVFAGQRPLVRPPGKDGSATKAISRNHEVLVSDSGLVTIVGGKWTTYRKMAEDTLNHASLIGGFDNRPCVTENLHLHGWRSPHAEALPIHLEVYGSDATKIEQLVAAEPALGRKSTRGSRTSSPMSRGRPATSRPARWKTCSPAAPAPCSSMPRPPAKPRPPWRSSSPPNSARTTPGLRSRWQPSRSWPRITCPRQPDLLSRTVGVKPAARLGLCESAPAFTRGADDCFFPAQTGLRRGGAPLRGDHHVSAHPHRSGQSLRCGAQAAACGREAVDGQVQPRRLALGSIPQLSRQAPERRPRGFAQVPQPHRGRNPEPDAPGHHDPRQRGSGHRGDGRSGDRRHRSRRAAHVARCGGDAHRTGGHFPADLHHRTVLVLIFGLWLKWLPVGGWGSLAALILPAVTLAIPYIAYVARLLRGSMIETLGQDFVRTARAKGLREYVVLYKHALRVAILPVVSYLGPLAAHLLTGSIVVETIFNIPGAGGFFVNSILNRDGFLLGGVVIVYCALLVAF